MLVLTRRVNERLYIGTDIVITICSIAPDRVRIGIDADISIPIVREELRHKNKDDRDGDSKS